MTSSSEQPPKESLVDEMMQEYSCIFYPMCFKARELLYCPKKIGKAECDDYRPHPAPAPCPQHQIWQHCPVAGEIARKAREDLLNRLDKEIATRENEMNRKGNLEDNLTTATGYLTAAGALNWVRVVLIDGSRDTIDGDALRTTPQQSGQEQPR